MLLSQKQSKLKLRREAGFSVALAAETVANLPKTQDGARAKVRLADLMKVIAIARTPSSGLLMQLTDQFRPFRKELREQIQRGKL